MSFEAERLPLFEPDPLPDLSFDIERLPLFELDPLPDLSFDIERLPLFEPDPLPDLSFDTERLPLFEPDALPERSLVPEPLPLAEPDFEPEPDADFELLPLAEPDLLPEPPEPVLLAEPLDPLLEPLQPHALWSLLGAILSSRRSSLNRFFIVRESSQNWKDIPVLFLSEGERLQRTAAVGSEVRFPVARSDCAEKRPRAGFADVLLTCRRPKAPRDRDPEAATSRRVDN